MISTPECKRRIESGEMITPEPNTTNGELYLGDNVDYGHAEMTERFNRSELAIHGESDDTIDHFGQFFRKGFSDNQLTNNLEINSQQIDSTTGEIDIIKSLDDKEELVVQFFDEKLIIGEESIDNNHPLGKFKLSQPSISKPIDKLYEPKRKTEKVKYKYKDKCFRNPSHPTEADVKIINEGISVKTRLRRTIEERKPKPDYNLSLVYSNLNPPILNKLSKLTKTFHLSSVFAISEIRTRRDLITSNEVIPLNMRTYIHSETNSGSVYAMIIMRNILDSEVSVIYDKAPFITVRIKMQNCNFTVTAFYRPHNESVIYKSDFSKEEWEKRLNDCIKASGKLPAVVMGDLNIDLENPCSTSMDLADRVETTMASFEMMETGPTFRRNDQIYTKIDYIWHKGMKDLSLEKHNGRMTVGNDGHDILSVRTTHNVQGYIGTTVINTRPKLIPETVNKLGNALYPDLKNQLTEAALDWYEKIEYGPYNPMTKAFDYDNNDYCEKALEFFEILFATLQPETKREVKIYNNKRHYSTNVTSLTIILASLDADLKELKGEREQKKLKKMMKKIIRIRERYRRADDRRAAIGRNRVNDDDIFAIAKALRPKLRGIQMSKEIFSAQELANEFIRVYSGITEHIKYSTEHFNLTDLLPRIDDAMRFSFKDYCPTWNNSLTGIKNISQCFRQLKPVTRGLDSSLCRNGMIHLPEEYTDIIDNMIFYWVHNGNYPDQFLSGKIKAILKKGNPNLVKNRRFISVGHMFQQLLGKIVASCLLGFFETGFLHQNQFGFRKGRSTELAVANLNLLVNSRHGSVMTYLFLLDLSSAFFCVKKKQLIEILSLYLDKNSLEFFKKMLKPRSAVVISDGNSSEPIEIPDDGVPQGEACSPLFFILVINEIFNYVPLTMNTFYDRLGIWLQGFADDSLLSVYGPNGWQKLIDEAFKRTNDFVETVGFKMNPTKTECIIFGNAAKRKEAGDSVTTPIGVIKIEKIVNVLGLRIDQRFSFLPQFLHVMKKMKSIQICLLELIGIGTNRQILAVAFSKSCGIYLYGLGIQPKWSQKQYAALQAEVLKAIRRIYKIKWNKENSWSQNDILRLANWPPVRIQHAKMSLLLLNKTIMKRNINNFDEVINRHLKTGNNRNFMKYSDRIRMFEMNPLDDTWLPRFVIDKDDGKQMANKVWKSFPFNSNYWLIRLPPFIRVLLGTKLFERAMILHFRLSCWHRTDVSCSICKHTIRIYPSEVNQYKNLLKIALNTLDTTEEEIETQTSEEITFLRSIDRKTFEEAENEDSFDPSKFEL